MLAMYIRAQYWIARREEARGDRGASAVEYGLLVGLIAVAIIAVLVVLGPQLAALFQNVSDELPDAPAPG